jgi:Protein kinase domain
MSPEQARGRPVDKRTDVWAFGCVLFEMLAGTPVFRGDTRSDTIAAVLEREPNWSCLPPATPLGIRRALRRYLEKDPNRRLRDARIEIEDTLSNQNESPASTPHAHLRTLAVLLALCAGGIVLGWWLHNVTGRDQVATRTTRFTWALHRRMARRVLRIPTGRVGVPGVDAGRSMRPRYTPRPHQPGLDLKRGGHDRHWRSTRRRGNGDHTRNPNALLPV